MKEVILHMKRGMGFLMALILLCSLWGCGEQPGEQRMPEENGREGADGTVEISGDRSKTFTFCYYEGGYGSQWLKAVTEDYMQNVNQDVFISMKSSTDNETEREKISSQVGTYDLYYIEVDMFEKAEALEELSGLLDREVFGESGVKVRDKIPEKWLDYYCEDGSYYQLPATNFMGWNWSYNKTLLDQTFGEGQYRLPNTTNEFFALGDKLFEKNVFLTAFAGNDTTGGADYLRYAYELWFAQMAGLEGYDHYFNCEYNADGTYQVAKESPLNIAENETTITEAYKIAETLCQGRNGVEYVHSKCESLSFLDAQFLLYQGTFKGMEEFPIAFYYNSASAEQEMKSYIEDGIIEKQDIRMMKMPVISAIIQRTPSIQDDAVLSAVVDYVDGTATELPAGVTQEDAAIVREARNMMAELVCREFVIVKDAENKEEIQEFLAYLMSDRAQMLAAQQCNGIPVLNYGYVPTEEDMGFAFSEFTKSAQTLAREAVIVDQAKFDKKLGRFLGLSWYKDKTVGGGTLSENLYTGQALGSADIYESTLDAMSGNWADRVEQYEIQKGQ